MRRVLLLLVFAGCSSNSPTYPAGMYPSAPGTPGAIPTLPGAPVAVPPMPGVPTMPVPGVAPVVPTGMPVVAPVAAPAPIPPGFREIRGAGFVFAVPAGWVDLTLPQSVAAARDPIPMGDLHTNANLIVEPFPSSDGAEYAAANVRGLLGMATVLGQVPITVAGHAGIDVESRWTNQIPPYRTRQRLTAANGTGYVLTCTASDARFEEARATCDAVLASFSPLP